MIKTTLKNVMQAMPCIDLLMAAKLPVKAAYAVGKLGRACAPEAEAFNRERDKIFAEAGCTIEDKGADAHGNERRQWVHSEPEKLAVALKQADELLTQEVELNALPLDLEQFGNADVPGAAFFGLGWAMKE